MLDLRPSCEHCNKALPPQSTDAMICSFECTYCSDCVRTVLGDVCPNCGGGFTQRPVRPATNHGGGFFLGAYPASTKVRHRPVDLAAHATLAAALRHLSPERR